MSQSELSPKGDDSVMMRTSKGICMCSSIVYITSAEGDDVQFNCTGRNATLLKIGGLSPKPATPPVLTLHCSDGGGGCTTSFLLTNVTSEDTGEYVCSMGLQTYYHLNVTAAPARRPLPTRSTHPDVVTSLFMTIPVPTETPTASHRETRDITMLAGRMWGWNTSLEWDGIPPL